MTETGKPWGAWLLRVRAVHGASAGSSLANDRRLALEGSGASCAGKLSDRSLRP